MKKVVTVCPYCASGCKINLVVDNGKIVQQGKHDDLIKQQGIYADFVLGRKEAIGWKLNAGN